MSDESRTCAREVSEYRKEFELDGFDRARLAAASALEGVDRVDALNAFWAEVGKDMGFVWTTVRSVGRAGILPSGRFTAEVPDGPDRDDTAAMAWIKSHPEHLGQNGEPHGGFELGDMLDIWHAGHESGVIAGAAIARMEGRVVDHIEPGDAELAAEFNSIVRSVDDSTGKRLGAILRLLQDRLDSARGEIQASRFSAEQRFAADMRAIGRWQAGEPDPAVRELLEAAVAALDGQHGGADVLAGFARLRAATRALPATWREPAEKRELMWPDHADLVCWLLAKVEAMEAVPLHPSTQFAEIVAVKLGQAGLLGVSHKTAAAAAGTIHGLIAVIDRQERKIASLRLQVPQWEPAMDSRPSDRVALALRVLDDFAAARGPFTRQDAMRVADTIREWQARPSRQTGEVTVGLSANGLALLQEAAGLFRALATSASERIRTWGQGPGRRREEDKIDLSVGLAERIEAELRKHEPDLEADLAGYRAGSGERYEPPSDDHGIMDKGL